MSCSNNINLGFNSKCENYQNVNSENLIVIFGEVKEGTKAAIEIAKMKKKGVIVVSVPPDTAKENLIDVLKEKGINLVDNDNLLSIPKKIELKSNVGEYPKIALNITKKYKSWEKPYNFHP